MYSFNKKDNSTKRPTGSGTAYQGEFKQGFALLSPVVKLLNVAKLPPFNYAYIPSLSRYYFITSWSFSGGFWYAALSCDVLASWKEEIRGQTCYVVRSASNYDEYIIDTEYPCTGKCTITSNGTGTAAENIFGGGGCFVVGIVGGAGGSGAISYYALTPGGFASLMGEMMGSLQYLNIDTDDLSQEMQKAFINPSQYITSCLWIPVQAGAVPGTAVGSIPAGWWSFSTGGKQIDPLTAIVGGQYTLTVPKHPKAASRGKYLNVSPYTEYTVNFFPFGTFALDTIRLQDKGSITLRYTMNCCSGEGALYVTDGAAAMKILTTNFGVPVPTGQVAFNLSRPESMVASVAGASVGAALSSGKEYFNALGGFFHNLFSGMEGSAASAALQEQVSKIDTSGMTTSIASAAAASLATVDITGHMGSNLYTIIPVSIVGKFLDITDSNAANRGRPCCKTLKLSVLSGYAQVNATNIEIGCTSNEREIIIRYLAGGVFFE